MARSTVLGHLDRAADLVAAELHPTLTEYSASVTGSIQVA